MRTCSGRFMNSRKTKNKLKNVYISCGNLKLAIQKSGRQTTGSCAFKEYPFLDTIVSVRARSHGSAVRTRAAIEVVSLILAAGVFYMPPAQVKRGRKTCPYRSLGRMKVNAVVFKGSQSRHKAHFPSGVPADPCWCACQPATAP